jgi:hypothetical protein
LPHAPFLSYYLSKIERYKQLINMITVNRFGGRKIMTEDRQKIEKLVERVDELLLVLNGVAEDLRQVSASLKSLAVSQITQPASPTPSPRMPTPVPGAPVIHEAHKGIEDIKMMFPEDLETLLSFEDKGEYIVIKPRQFLGSENFAKIASTVRGIGGEYISAGKESHFRVPKKKT